MQLCFAVVRVPKNSVRVWDIDNVKIEKITCNWYHAQHSGRHITHGKRSASVLNGQRAPGTGNKSKTFHDGVVDYVL